jgi:hypothetical protein
MEKKIPTYLLIIDEELSSELQVDAVAMVDAPAIERNFLQFRSEFVNPNSGEKKDDFIPRCISYVINEGKDTDQAVAICNGLWDEHFAAESYDDYPKEASENAKVALRWAEENGWGECGTAVGKARANQLANGEAISRDTIARMSAFERHRQNSQKQLGDGCGRLMWLAWGGDAGIEWATRKLQQIDKAKMSAEKISIDYDDTLSTERGKELAKKLITNGATLYIISARDNKEGMLSVGESLGVPGSRIFATGSNEAKVQKIKDLGITKHYDNNADVVKALGTIGEKFSIQLSFGAINEDKQEIFGPAMLADVPIYRNDEQLGEYNVVFDKATIYKIAQKFFEKDFNKNFNLMHDPNQKCTNVYAFQSYIVDSEEGRPAPKGYEDAKDGSWFLGVKVNNPEVWAKIKSGEIKGFSVEGVFEYKKKELSAEQLYNEIKQLLEEIES